MSWFRRRWRSVSFRAGLVSAALVGAITVVVALIVVGLVFGLVAFAAQSLQLMLHERGVDQLRLGVGPDELDVGFIESDTGGGGSFWAVFSEGELLRAEGTYDDDVIAAPLVTDGQFLTVERETAGSLEQGTKTVDGRTWFFLSDDVAHEGVTYTFVTASDSGVTYGGFLLSALWIIAVVTLVTSAVAGLVTGVFSRLALRSVERMRAEVQHISRESLDRRVPTTGAGDGVDKLAHTMNDMLGRLEDSSNQQGEFLAAASHELRSPVAGLLAQLDVAVAYPDRMDVDALLPKLQTEAQRLQLLVDDLLYLSRSEALSTARPAPDTSSVAVDELLQHEADQVRDRHRDVTVTVSGLSGLQVAGRERDLSRAVRNLAENAARHARTAVELSVAVRGSMAAVTVSDDGTGVAAADAERIFGRFVRLDDGRARDDGGSGLGLAIVREIARQHGGDVSLVSGSQPGATFQLLLPLA